MNKLKIWVLLLALAFQAMKPLWAQENTLIMRHKETGYVFEVDPEKAVRYKLQDGVSEKGYIEQVNQEDVVISGKNIQFEDITMLSSWHTRKNANAKTGGIFLTTVGGMLTVAGVLATVEGFRTDDVAETTINVPVGLAATGVGLGTTYLGLRALKRKRFDMKEWDFVVNNY